MQQKQPVKDFRFTSFIYGFVFGVAVMAVAWFVV